MNIYEKDITLIIWKIENLVIKKHYKKYEKILRDIALFEVEDVRPVIEKINDFIKISRNMINPYSNIDIRKILFS